MKATALIEGGQFGFEDVDDVELPEPVPVVGEVVGLDVEPLDPVPVGAGTLPPAPKNTPLTTAFGWVPAVRTNRTCPEMVHTA